MSEEVTIRITRGDSKKFRLVARRDRLLEDITAAKIYFTIKTNKTDLDSAALVTKDSAGNNGIVKTDSPNGEFTLEIFPEDTNGLALGEYWYDIQIRAADNTVHTAKKGPFIIDYDITRRIT